MPEDPRARAIMNEAPVVTEGRRQAEEARKRWEKQSSACQTPHCPVCLTLEVLRLKKALRKAHKKAQAEPGSREAHYAALLTNLAEFLKEGGHERGVTTDADGPREMTVVEWAKSTILNLEQP